MQWLIAGALFTAHMRFGYSLLTPIRRCSLYMSRGYEFIDCGGLERLERFGEVIVRRSCPAASKSKNPSLLERWNLANLRYEGSSGKVGSWSGALGNESRWEVDFNGSGVLLQLTPSPQGQIGVFPEQQSNWEWIRNTLQSHHRALNSKEKEERIIRVLNGFAYTGGSSLAALNAADNILVTHLDASKASNQWAARNIEAAVPLRGKNVRCITEDCLTYINREIRRNSRYDMLIFDPPAFGRSGSKIWKLETDLEVLVSLLPSLLSDQPCGILLSCHDINWSHERLALLLRSHMDGFRVKGVVSSGNLVLRSEDKKCSLAMGCYARWVPS